MTTQQPVPPQKQWILLHERNSGPTALFIPVHDLGAGNLGVGESGDEGFIGRGSCISVLFSLWCIRIRASPLAVSTPNIDLGELKPFVFPVWIS